MESLFLIKPGEILLKQDNQKEFTTGLIKQIKARMNGSPCTIQEFPGRFFLSVEEKDRARAEFVLSHCPGINGYALATVSPKTVDDVLSAGIEVARDSVAAGLRTFKAETRRSDKSFPLGSYQLSALAGERILSEFSSLTVNVHEPDFTINFEIRERAYIYGMTKPGPRGLPTGSAGRGLLLLSGGIDSPVAGYMMAKRGLYLEAVYFHTYPYTSREAQQKVETLALTLAEWSGGIRLWIVPFTDVQMQIKKGAEESATTLMLRSAMMETADKIAKKIKAKALITGESLGQVASQTCENMRITQAPTSLPVFRPLVGSDKEDIIAIARKIGTFETSILPYEDCCVLFSPRHPLLSPSYEEQTSAYEKLGLSALIDESINKAETKKITYKDVLTERGL